MKTWKNLVAASLLAVAGGGLFIACGDTLEDDCLLDGDCETGFVCEDEVCVETCTIDDDCAFGEVCELRQNSTDGTKVCKPDTSANNTGTNNTGTNNTGTNNTVTNCSEADNPDLYCAENAGAGTLCFEDDCISDVRVVKVEDQTTDADACASTTDGKPDPGSDIYGIWLEQQDGTPVGFATYVDYAPTDDENGYAGADLIFDGTPPSGDAGTCPEAGFTDESVVSLSCGGHALVQFVDSENQVVPLTPDLQIVVGEYGSNCTNNASEDLYRLYLCEPGTGATEGDEKCTQALGADNETGLGTIAVDQYVP